MRGELFKGVKQWDFDLRGVKLKLPVFYYDNTSLEAIYTASTRKVRQLLPDPRMNPIEMSPGRCVVVFGAFEYRDSDIGPYNEFAIAFLVAFDKRQIPGLTVWSHMRQRSFSLYIWQLPVTTEIARRGGVDLYGFPKFLAEIDFERGRESVSCRLAENGKEILVLDGKAPSATRGRQQRFLAYSMMGGVPLVATVVIDNLESAEERGRQAARISFEGSHPISETFRQLELSTGPVVYTYSPLTEAILFAGRNLIDS